MADYIRTHPYADVHVRARLHATLQLWGKGDGPDGEPVPGFIEAANNRSGHTTALEAKVYMRRDVCLYTAVGGYYSLANPQIVATPNGTLLSLVEGRKTEADAAGERNISLRASGRTFVALSVGSNVDDNAWHDILGKRSFDRGECVQLPLSASH